jgi:ATP-dependent helicase YprA (DUF1998 family)
MMVTRSHLKARMPGTCVFAVLSGFRNRLGVSGQPAASKTCNCIGSTLLVKLVLERIQLAIYHLLEEVEIFRCLLLSGCISACKSVSCCRDSLTHDDLNMLDNLERPLRQERKMVKQRTRRRIWILMSSGWQPLYTSSKHSVVRVEIQSLP